MIVKTSIHIGPPNKTTEYIISVDSDGYSEMINLVITDRTTDEPTEIDILLEPEEAEALIKALQSSL